jgi:2'-5' RNA ligase
VAYLLKDLAVGNTFKPDLLHLTIVPWFVTELDDEEVIKSFSERFSNDKALDVTIGEEGEFKNKRKILVNFVKPSLDILSLHTKALEWLEELETRWAVKNPHVGPEYIPHVRRRAGSHNLSEGEALHISSLSLVRAHRRGDDIRTVAAKVKLG